MRIEGDPIPFRATQAYGLDPARAMTGAGQVDPVRPIERQPIPSINRIDGPEVRVAPSKIDRLVAAYVPGSIDFSDAQARPAAPSPALPFYTRPGQKNEAMTSIVANTGRSLDVRG